MTFVAYILFCPPTRTFSGVVGRILPGRPRSMAVTAVTVGLSARLIAVIAVTAVTAVTTVFRRVPLARPQ